MIPDSSMLFTHKFISHISTDCSKSYCKGCWRSFFMNFFGSLSESFYQKFPNDCSKLVSWNVSNSCRKTSMNSARNKSANESLGISVWTPSKTFPEHTLEMPQGIWSIWEKYSSMNICKVFSNGYFRNYFKSNPVQPSKDASEISLRIVPGFS